MQRFTERIGWCQWDLHDGEYALRSSDRPDSWTNEHESGTLEHCSGSTANVIVDADTKGVTMICVTGARGTLGSQVITQLEGEKASFRAAHFSERGAEAARARGIEVAIIDYNQPETLRAAFRGCDTVFLLGPNLEDQTGLELNAVEAAVAAGVRHVVKQSVMVAAEEEYSLAKVHRPVEKAIEASGLGWTFLRPNSFMQNAVTFMAPTIRAQGAFYSASGDARISHVDVRDIAAVAVSALTTASHEGKSYTLTGPEALTYDEMAGELSKALGRDIRHISLSPGDLKSGMLAEGLPEALADRMLDLEHYFREDRASVVTDDVREVTGREPRRFADYVRETAATGIWNAEADASRA